MTSIRNAAVAALLALLLLACPSRTSPEDASADPPEVASEESEESEEREQESDPDSEDVEEDGDEASSRAESWEAKRREMVETQIAARGVDDERVLTAMLNVPRHRFVPPRYRSRAHVDRPLPIGEDQTISQPLIVALMSQLAGIEPGDKVLEIGTGSGYHAAVMAEMGATVYTIEIIESLGRSARLVLEGLGYEDVHVRIGDGYQGWPEHAPFDAIVVTAAPPEIPQPLKDQLAVGGRMVLPVGDRYQELEVIERTAAGFERERHGAVRFVPMTGEAQK